MRESIAFVLFLVLVVAAPARAALTLGVAPETPTTLLPGGTLSLELRLTEVIDPGAGSVFDTGDGLVTSEITAELSGPAAFTALAANTEVFTSELLRAVAFDATTAAIFQGVAIAEPTGTSGTPLSPDVRFVTLGQVAVTAAADAAPGTEIVLSLLDNPAFEDTLLADGTVLDAGIAGSTVTLTVVPEPAGAGVAVVAFMLLRRGSFRSPDAVR